MKPKIKFSIITVTFNARSELKKTIRSIQSQNYKYFIHIIKDGLSEDKTNSIDFSKYKNTKFYESKDKGIYDAMNQGLKFSENEYIIFLNAGDIFFCKTTLQDLAENIRKNPYFNSYSGGTIQLNSAQKKIKRLIGIGKPYKALPLSQLPHPSFVIKKSTLSNLFFPFDSNLIISADYKLQLILRKRHLWKNCYLNQIISIMPTGGKSTINNRSIIYGYKETFVFSYKLYNIICIYILFIKLILHFYSRLETSKLKNHSIIFDTFYK